jgi:hypothetical protein
MNKRNTLVGPQLQRGGAGFNPEWKRLVAFVAMIVLGSIVATQVLANSYRFHPALGFNVFHVYPPWSYFLWSTRTIALLRPGTIVGRNEVPEYFAFVNSPFS